ncbi:hypothetical protein FNV43_RR27029 [Rhamnella rubrinervis]|uniref:Uncharacterized protein n=1 Tax=Rhamnella rubrinervis TaxID=2594499 RepID=A0A8K0DJV0_9ROSA|nr:hypothetical protein FNV43_RR27029 [Rhamnella rubrinervis]
MQLKVSPNTPEKGFERLCMPPYTPISDCHRRPASIIQVGIGKRKDGFFELSSPLQTESFFTWSPSLKDALELFKEKKKCELVLHSLSQVFAFLLPLPLTSFPIFSIILHVLNPDLRWRVCTGIDAVPLLISFSILEVTIWSTRMQRPFNASSELRCK